jgi:hypothetical protein
MSILSPDTPFHLVHIGKCGGSTVASELQAANFRFNHFHMQRPVARSETRYVILARDPVARFVSAFNWRKHLYINGTLPRPQFDGPLSELRHRPEREFLFRFEDANALAEQLGTHGIYEVTAASSLLALIGHVPQGFDWYLSHLLEQIKANQIVGVICTERLTDDFEHLFGFRPKLEIHRVESSQPTWISKEGRANLIREFHREYAVLHKLTLMARDAGVRMSMRYDPTNGATINP